MAAFLKQVSPLKNKLETLWYLSSTNQHLGCAQPFFSSISKFSMFTSNFKKTANKQTPSPKPLLLLLLSHFSRVRLCVTPEMAAHQAPPSLGFSRQGHWSGLPFPSPVHESEKWKWSSSVVSDCSRPHGLQPTRLPRSWDFPGKSTGVECHCLLDYDNPLGPTGSTSLSLHSPG